MIKEYIKSQSGAALLLILFVVVFLTITGSMLLNSSTYSKSSIIKNKVEEEEFYLLEGAVELVLYNLQSTQLYQGGTEQLLDINGNKVFFPKNTPLFINKRGTFFFIQDFFSKKVLDNNYLHVFDNIVIDGKEIQYHVELVDTDNSSYFNVDLSASLVENASINRTINFTVSPETKPVEDYVGNSTIRDDYIQSPFSFTEADIKHQKQIDTIKEVFTGQINKTEKLIDLGVKLSSERNGVFSPATIVKESPSYYTSIAGFDACWKTKDGPKCEKDAPTIIPENTTIYADSFNWTGNTGTLIVKGVLIVNVFDLQSNNRIEVTENGTIIALEKFKVGSNSPYFKFPPRGDSNGEGTSSRRYNSDVYWSSDSIKIENYQTGR